MTLKALFFPKDSSSGKRVEALDGFRFLFIFLVGWFHIWQQSWLTPHTEILGKHISLDPLLRTGYIWVDCMLLLSGMVLMLPYALNPDKEPEKISVFYKKRFLRIYPSYALAVLFFFFLHKSGYNGNTGFMARDLAAHLSMTHIFFFETYYGSPLNGALWTVGVEWWFYLLFPLILRLYKKRPMFTLLVMTGIALLWRSYAGQTQLGTKQMLFNQLPAFLDTYAFGFLGAEAYAAFQKRRLGEKRSERVFFTAVAALCVFVLNTLITTQASASGQDGIFQGQMNIRFMLSLSVMCLMVCACFSLKGVRLFFGNRVFGFLAGVTYWFYMIHQPLAVLMKQNRWIPSVSDTPNMAGEFAWQLPYTLLCFVFPFALSVLLTYGFEKPIARALSRVWKLNDKPTK